MSVDDLRGFLESVGDEPSVRWWLKRLSPNDTQQTGGHQAGIYVPKRVMFHLVPELERPEIENPRIPIFADVESHDISSTIHAIWYNNELRGRSRNEVRMTGWGGGESPLLDPAYTGLIVAFAFTGDENSRRCRVWVCRDGHEDDLLEERFSEVVAGDSVFVPPIPRVPTPTNCWLSEDAIPLEWMEEFPSSLAIFEHALKVRPEFSRLPVDKRIIDRRKCEQDIFESVHSAHIMPKVRGGFESYHGFIDFANAELNRRKNRSGKSLERHIERIFGEAGLIEGHNFDQQVLTEHGYKADFIFPSEQAYYDHSVPSENLRMLGVKTSLKDRWSQVLPEADRIAQKHLLTLDNWVSDSSCRRIHEAGVILVVPEQYHKRYPEWFRPEVMSVAEFIEEVSPLAGRIAQ